jgi:3-amino-4-hydroxybenzoate 4-O-methyltransferase
MIDTPSNSSKTIEEESCGSTSSLIAVERLDLQHDGQTLVRSLALSRMISLACELDLADLLPCEQSRVIAEVALELNLPVLALTRLCRALVAAGLFEIDEDLRLHHNSLSMLCRKDQPGSLYWSARFWGLPAIWKTWCALGEAIRQDTDIFKEVNGNTFFDYLRFNEVDEKIYRAYMVAGYPDRHQQIAALLQIAGNERIVDVGGSYGELLDAVRKRFPAIRPTLFDLPDVAKDAQLRHSLSVRDGFCEVVGGSFFGDIPQGADIYLLSYVLHDWPDEDVVRILKACRVAAHADSRLIIIDRLLPNVPTKEHLLDFILDINMLLLHRGRERNIHEFNNLLRQAGFSHIHNVQNGINFSILEAAIEGLA